MISHKRKFVFIHIPKTGGSSVASSGIKKKCRVKGHNSRHPKYPLFKDMPPDKDVFYFAFVRNPWDRLVSSFFYLKGGGNQKRDAADFKKYFGGAQSFSSLLKNWDDFFANQIHFKPQYQWICDKEGDVTLDFVGHFENLQEDFNIVCDKIGIQPRKLPHRNKTEHKHYSEYYTDETRELVAEKYAKDIEHFGYKFGE